MHISIAPGSHDAVEISFHLPSIDSKSCLWWGVDDPKEVMEARLLIHHDGPPNLGSVRLDLKRKDALHLRDHLIRLCKGAGWDE